ncbi:hypothetical protein LL033_11915 [Clostridium estertheticum]|uniref:hypothetical protein n=1 Tax=Clostridium estertheticum TaxID=238834 RepID=UPI001C0B1570|nr:hypothetical protein [Clostridium estertheticum]MBU3215857.1 hypothetical protein [Clostridium estertheticum]WAG57813.1 hypothetical protein LL033_11915 [Clostridium estertheticum]
MKSKMKVTEDNLHVLGIYAIQTKEGVPIYVGSSSMEVVSALGRHLYFLKRGQYADTNKAEMQKLYDMECLEFVILKEIETMDVYRNMSTLEKEQLNECMSVWEQLYIDMYRDTIVNSHNTVHRHSSNKNDGTTTEKRRLANIGSKNPMSKYSEELISNILYLKENGYKPQAIMEMLEKHNVNMDMDKQYISILGASRWVYTSSKKPIWLEENNEEIEPIQLENNMEHTIINEDLFSKLYFDSIVIPKYDKTITK